MVFISVHFSTFRSFFQVEQSPKSRRTFAQLRCRQFFSRGDFSSRRLRCRATFGAIGDRSATFGLSASPQLADCCAVRTTSSQIAKVERRGLLDSCAIGGNSKRGRNCWTTCGSSRGARKKRKAQVPKTYANQFYSLLLLCRSGQIRNHKQTNIQIIISRINARKYILIPPKIFACHKETCVQMSHKSDF